MTPKKQNPKDQFWLDETGIKIPSNRLRKSEKLRENKAFTALTKAMAINSDLVAFKELIKEATQEVLTAVYTENDVVKKDSKGNFTWHNFDRSIKVECSINERIEFDDTLITLCKDKLNEFISDNLKGTDEFVHALVVDAFHNTKGKLDTKKVMSLLKHRSKIKDHRYGEAMNFLEQSIRRPDSKSYYRVAHKNEEGKYEYVELNFSAI